MASPILLISEVFPTADTLDTVVRNWKAMEKPAVCNDRAVFSALDQSSCLELIALNDISEIAQLESHFDKSWSLLGIHLAGDFQRQLLRFVEAPKSLADALPATPFIQLRHVEVRPPVYADYLSWRDRTIFDVVRNAEEVESFLAYHSVLSSEPGVMFVSAFSCPVEQYTSVFSSDHYKDIVAQAGNQYITGGERGLYTKIYAAA